MKEKEREDEGGKKDTICGLLLEYPRVAAVVSLSGILVATLYSGVISSLALRLKFSWWGWVPVGVSRRRATHSERASARLDMKFSWKLRGVATLFFLTLALLLPKVPYLTHTSPPLPPKTLASRLRSSAEKAWYLKYFTDLVKISAFVLFVSQFLLNQRARTFGDNYRFLAGIDLASSGFHALPVLLSARWGRWELMEPMDFSEVLEVARHAGFAWQAWRLSGVKQEEEEDE